jgi:peptidoglycan/LPS O-acetylase OafA/YrhL
VIQFKYRPEIDGMRAIAVLSVILNHAGFVTVPGGFVGVDIFFVISGYLITSIILKEITQNRFSFLKFYQRRIRRIIPALFLVMFASLVTAYFMALPAQLEDISKSAIAVALSVSNFYFWSQSGYFAPASEFMPLLHTWSLGVEEQFYFLFPIITYIVCTKTKLSIRWLFVVLLLPLFLCSVYLSYHSPSFAFYLLPARAWELTLGAVLASNVIPTANHRLLKEGASSIGLLLILSSIFSLNSTVIYPGYFALIPCIGAALIIHYATEGTWVNRMLSKKTFVFIGLISYSLYLWHWPILAFTRMYNANIHLSLVQISEAIILSFVLAILSWRYVESPFRNTIILSRYRLPVATLGAFLLLITGITASVSIAGKGIPDRLNLKTQHLLLPDDHYPIQDCSGFDKSGRKNECKIGSHSSSVSYVIIGDSHAEAMRLAFDNNKTLKNKTGALWWHKGCALLVDAHKTSDPDDSRCSLFKEKVIRALQSSPEIKLVILPGRWAVYFNGSLPETSGSYRSFLFDKETLETSEAESAQVFQRSIAMTVDKINAMGKEVIIIGDNPEAGFDVPTVLALASFHGKKISPIIKRSDVIERNQKIDLIFNALEQTRPMVHYIKTWDIYCKKDCALIKNGTPIYVDHSHISKYTAATILKPKLEARMKPLMIAINKQA